MRSASPRLGRGLAALLGEERRSHEQEVALKAVQLLEPSPFQPRSAIQNADLEELASSIRTQGMLQPILVRPHGHQEGRFQIIAGERRWRAAMLAGLAEVPCFIRSLSDADASAAALVENLQRQDLNPIEEAEGFRRLIEDFGLTQERLGAAIGKSRSHVANALRLLNLPDGVVAHVRGGRLTAGHARAALACSDPLSAAQTMIAQSMSVRQAEALSSASSEAKPVTRRPVPTDPDIHAVEADLAGQLGLHVSISFNGRGGTISLRYRSLDQLDYVVAKLGRP